MAALHWDSSHANSYVNVAMCLSQEARRVDTKDPEKAVLLRKEALEYVKDGIKYAPTHTNLLRWKTKLEQELNVEP